jgi:Holliday junction resolvase-like predicted endonuclease
LNCFAQISESAVADALARSGWTVIERNLRRRGSEIDIVTCKGDTLVFLEVKFRHVKPTGLSEIEALLPYRKKIALARGAVAFLSDHDEYRSYCWRFDLVLTWKGTTGGLSHEYFPNVFDYSEVKSPM